MVLPAPTLSQAISEPPKTPKMELFCTGTPFGYVTNTDPPNGCMPSAATFRLAGEHAVARCH